MIDAKKSIRIIKKGEDYGNLKYYLSLTHRERLEHLEQLRTHYIKWNNSDDCQSGFQRVYTIVKRP